MSDLSIIRSNFNKLLDWYEEQGVTINDIKQYLDAEVEYASRANIAFIENTVRDSVPLLSDEVKEKFDREAASFIKIGIDIGSINYLTSLSRDDFMENLNKL